MSASGRESRPAALGFGKSTEPERRPRAGPERSEEATLDLHSSAMEARLQRVHRHAQGGGGFRGAFAEDVSADEHVARRRVELADDHRDSVPELPVDELLLGARAFELEWGAVV